MLLWLASACWPEVMLSRGVAGRLLDVWMSAFVMGDCFFFFFKTSIKVSFCSKEIDLLKSAMNLGGPRLCLWDSLVYRETLF